MFYQRVDIPINEPYPEYITLLPIGDIHHGNPYSNLAKALEFRQFILDTPYTYTIDGGDDLDCVTKESKGNIYEQVMSPYFQKKETLNFWRPVAKAGKLWCVLDDNHSYRVKDLADWRIMSDVSEELGVLYGGWGAFIDIRIIKDGKDIRQYTVYTVHGKRSAITDSGALNNVIRMNQRAIADIYLRFHHHRKIVHQDEIKKLTFSDNKWVLAEHKRTYAINGSFLEWDNSYAEMNEYNISIKGCIKFKLFVDKWDVHISL